MALKTIAIMSPGDMGHGVGETLIRHGYDVITCLAGRSDRTRGLAKRAGFRIVEDLRALVTQADLVMSILVPAHATELARQVADAIGAADAATPFAECNAISPRTTRQIESIIVAAGGRYIDGGIIGGSPARGAVPRIYCSGVDAVLLEELDGKGIAIKNLGDEIGRASGIKMCYASMTKGTTALQVAMLTAARSLGLYQELVSELASSQGEALHRAEVGIPRLPANSGRWIGEMDEIAATFDAAGVTPHFHQGAAEIFKLLARTSFATESPEGTDESRTLAETIDVLAELLPDRLPAGD